MPLPPSSLSDALDTEQQASDAASQMPRHCIAPPSLSMTRTFYPLGFAVQVYTNEQQIFTILQRMWGRFSPLKSSELAPLRFDVYVVEGGIGEECPPATVFRLLGPLLMAVADQDNYSSVDLHTLHSQVCMRRGTLAYPLYAEWFLLGAPLSCIATHLSTPIHGACISRNGQGVLLCGDSGAGKSTLAYACARSGWHYVSDDAVFVPHHEKERVVIGNCHQVRFRPNAAELFPEVAGRDITPRAAGKPSIEIPITELPHIQPQFTAKVDYIVFLDRGPCAEPSLTDMPVEQARHSLRNVLFGLPERVDVQQQTLERMLTAPIYKLSYERLQDAVDLLEFLTQDEA